MKLGHLWPPAIRFTVSLAASLGISLFQAPRVAAQTSPATLPDLKLSKEGSVHALVIQPDGKLIVGGHFSSVNGRPRSNLARLNPNGSLDLGWNPGSTDSGTVAALVINGNDVVVGGTFQSIGGLPRNGLAKVSLLDGNVDPIWNPAPGSFAHIGAIALDGTNLFVGGSFNVIGGQSLTNIAKLSIAGAGAADPVWRPNANKQTLALVVAGTNLFVAGDFDQIGGQTRRAVAKLRTAGLGQADPIWNPNPTSASVIPRAIALAANSSNVFVCGAFDHIGGLSRSNLVKLSLAGTGAADAIWNPNPAGYVLPVHSLALSDTNLFVQGYFSSIGGQSISNLAKITTEGTGAADALWRPSLPYNDPLTGVLVVDGLSLFVGGDFTVLNNEVSLSLAKTDQIIGQSDRNFSAAIEIPGTVLALARQADGKTILGGTFWFVGELPRRNLARMNSDGSLDITWAPSADASVSAIAINGTNVFVGGYFARINGVGRNRIAKLSTLGTDSVDLSWNPNADSAVLALTSDGSALFVGGNFHNIGGASRSGLAKLNELGIGSADPIWNPTIDGNITTLAIGGSNIFVGGDFDSIRGQGRTNLAKLPTTGVGDPDPTWAPNPVRSGGAQVLALAIAGPNLFVGGIFEGIGSQPRRSLAKLSTGSGTVDPDWNPSPGPGDVFVQALAVTGTNLYVAGTFGSIGGQPVPLLARLSTVGLGLADPSWRPDPIPPIDVVFPQGPVVLSLRGNDLYAGGYFESVWHESRSGFAFLPVADAPQLIQDSPTNLFVFPSTGDGPEITHFQIKGITGGALLKSDGASGLNVGDFISVAEGAAGLKFVPGGTVTVVSALNNTPTGAGMAASSLTMNTNLPTFQWSATAYSVREGQGNVVVTVRKYGSGTGAVNYATSDLTSTGGADYQTRGGTFNFSATDQLKNIIITIADDLLIEGDEQFAVTLTNLSAGASIAGPVTTVVTIADNDIVGVSDSLTTTIAPASPPASTGVLAVSLQPTNANGQWRLVGELQWHSGGAAISGLVNGNYGVEFRPVNGYFPPAATPVTVPVSAGMTNQFAFFYAATTNLETGKLSVLIQPGDVASAADPAQRGQWRRQGTTNWLDSGDLVPNLNAGSYAVEFKPVSGRATPLPQLVQVGGADAIYSGVGTYYFASSPMAATPSVVPFGTATTNAPYLYNGQLQTSVGFGSGFVVKQRVVLTAAHVLFDDVVLSYTTEARWLFQRYRDQLAPVPQVPRGWYVFEGYASQRQLDDSPGLSTPISQNLDAAALYFLEDAGRGGYGGYFSSDADNNEYLLSANNKFLVGYPLEGVALADQGKLFATSPANLTFTHLYTGIFGTTNIQSFPGNSGGPLYVQADVDKYLPAAICLGGSGQTLVRAINSEVVDLINRAEISANGGGNIVGGGVTLLSPGLTAPPFGTGLLTVDLTPANPNGARVGWRIMGDSDTNFFTDAITTLGLIGGGGYPIEFKAVPGFVTPSNRTVQITVGQVVTLQADYVPIRPLLGLNPTTGLSLSGATGGTYRVEFATNLAATITWAPLLTTQLNSSPTTVSGTLPASTGSRFYRAVLVP